MDEKYLNDLPKLREKYESMCMNEDAYRVMCRRMEQGKKERLICDKKKSYIKWIIVTAAVVTLVVLPNISSSVAYAMGNIPVIGRLFRVVIFRDYQFEDDYHSVDVTVPQITMDTEDNSDGETEKEAKKSVEEVNKEIRKIADAFVQEFENNMENEAYQEISIKSEIIVENNSYFTLKLICYQGGASGYETVYYYTIDSKTGKKMNLEDFFNEGSDYQTVISSNIKQQMKEQMVQNEDVSYWLDDELIPEANFDRIKQNQPFYINEDGEIVVCFSECEVAPAYMGSVEFIIPNEVVDDILVNPK